MLVSEAQTSRPLDADSDTVPKLLLRNAKRFADRPASRLKDLGIWQTHTWSQVRDEVRTWRSDCIRSVSSAATRSRSSAIICRGSTGRSPRSSRLAAFRCRFTRTPSPMRWPTSWNTPEVSIAVVENQEQVDKLLSISEQVPSLKQVVYSDPRGLVKYDHTHLHSFADLQKLGAEQRLAVKTPSSTTGGWARSTRRAAPIRP